MIILKTVPTMSNLKIAPRVSNLKIALMNLLLIQMNQIVGMFIAVKTTNIILSKEIVPIITYVRMEF